MQSPQALTKPGLLIVEGAEDKAFFDSLLKFVDIQNLAVEELKGKTELPNYLKRLPARSGFSGIRSLGIVRDADLDESRSVLQSIQANLKNAGLPAPKKVRQLSPETAGRRAAVFIFEKTRMSLACWSRSVCRRSPKTQNWLVLKTI
jgi:hypothetical protein